MQTSDGDTSPQGSYRIYGAESLGAAIRHFRRQAGLSQQELADKAGLNRTYLADIEGGKQTEQVRRTLRLLRQLGVRLTAGKADW